MFKETSLPGVIEICPRRFGDERGFLFESWSAEKYRACGVDAAFVQDNVSFSPRTGTVRGLHFQLPPYDQAKLVSCLSGRILDLAVDLRPGSRTRGQTVALEISAEAGNQIFVPAGFAHGFCTLTSDCLVAYKLSNLYEPEAERSIAFDDPSLGVDWPVSRDRAHLSEKDRAGVSLARAFAELDALV